MLCAPQYYICEVKGDPFEELTKGVDVDVSSSLLSSVSHAAIDLLV